MKKGGCSAALRGCPEELEGMKKHRIQDTLLPGFPIKKLIKLFLFLTDKVLEPDLKGIAQS